MASNCVLELKNEFKASDVYKIVSMIEKAGYLDHVIFISFALKNLISLRRRYPTQPAQYLIKEWDDKLLDTLEKYNLGIDIYYKSATRTTCRESARPGSGVQCLDRQRSRGRRRPGGHGGGLHHHQHPGGHQQG